MALDDEKLWMLTSAYQHDLVAKHKKEQKQKDEIIGLKDRRIEHLLFEAESHQELIKRLQQQNERQRAIIRGDNVVDLGDVG